MTWTRRAAEEQAPSSSNTAQGSRKGEQAQQGQARRGHCGACAWRAPVAPQLSESRAVGQDDSDCRGGVAVRLLVEPGLRVAARWRAERRCRGSIPRPALCVGCEELAVLSRASCSKGRRAAEAVCRARRGARGGQRARGEVPGTGHGAGWGSDADKRAGRVRTPSTSRS
jgi:hypothetical protein